MLKLITVLVIFLTGNCGGGDSCYCHATVTAEKAAGYTITCTSESMMQTHRDGCTLVRQIVTVQRGQEFQVNTEVANVGTDNKLTTYIQIFTPSGPAWVSAAQLSKIDCPVFC